MDGDPRLTRRQIIEEADAIRRALENCSSPSERQRLMSRYAELETLIRSGTANKNVAEQHASNLNVAAYTDATRKCPFCAETIKAEAIKCRFCGEMLNGSSVSSQPPPLAPPAQKIQKVGTSIESIGRSMTACGCLILSALALFVVIGGATLDGNDGTTNPIPNPQNQAPRIAPSTPPMSTQRVNANAQAGSIEAQIKEFVAREYPNAKIYLRSTNRRISLHARSARSRSEDIL